jgi:manganese/zinc/iron transport system permease protein
MNGLLPPLDWHRIFVEPWTEVFPETFWTVVMGFLVTAGCGLIGNYLLLRRMALVGDAISHSILPGLVLAFVLFRTTATWVAFLGAVAAGWVTVLLIEFIHKQSRVKEDAAICIAFTTLFAIGVMMISALETQGSFHIDADCVLYGEISFVSQEPFWIWGGLEIAPWPVVRMAALFSALVACILIFYKELLVTSFDPGLAQSLGINVALWHYGLMGALSLMIVGVFEAVGAILAVAMLVVPAMFAAQLSTHLPTRLVLTCVHAAASSLLGYHLAVGLDCAAAGGMVVAGAGLFVAAWIVTGLLQRRAARAGHPSGIASMADAKA